MTLRRAILLGLLVAAGCATEVLPVEPASLELGTGSWRFESLTDGQELELVRGAQGGWHVWISMRTRGLGERPMITTTVEPADESRPAFETETIASLDPQNDDGFRDFVGFTLIINEPSCLVGEMMRVQASVEVDGELLSVDRYFVPLAGTYPPPACE